MVCLYLCLNRDSKIHHAASSKEQLSSATQLGPLPPIPLSAGAVRGCQPVKVLSVCIDRYICLFLTPLQQQQQQRNMMHSFREPANASFKQRYIKTKSNCAAQPFIPTNQKKRQDAATNMPPQPDQPTPLIPPTRTRLSCSVQSLWCRGCQCRL